ncbi:MAG: adenosylcobinamide amidohydrolase [Peptococcaceae bacterium]|nr:adenosylcobinamide amidohydrolase [Candidatus Syntrophopropionicum ammoniitolerans]
MTEVPGVLLEYIFPRPGKWSALQKGLFAFPGSDYILVAAAPALFTISTGVIGGGIGHKHYFINRQVEKGYSSSLPANEMTGYLASQFTFYNGAASKWVALMTAAPIVDACWARVTHQKHQIDIIITAGVNNACSAGVTPYCALGQDKTMPGTINTMAFISHALTPGALVNAVQTATEAKTQLLREFNITCPVTGSFASGTNTDATLIAAASDTAFCEYAYAGSGTLLGYMLASGVRGALTQALRTYLVKRKQAFMITTSPKK